ncbi:MAG: response regulator [Planctomycetes bacterium]|nr:response regulator [Planctomycetota bacterium]
MTTGCDIFHVDDNVGDLELTRLAFEDAAASVRYRAFSNPTEALALLEARAASGGFPPPDLLVLDVNMPIMNGIDVLESLHRSGLTARFAVVMLTTSGRPEDERRCLELGARAYMVKPDHYSDLVHLAKRLLTLCE